MASGYEEKGGSNVPSHLQNGDKCKPYSSTILLLILQLEPTAAHQASATDNIPEKKRKMSESYGLIPSNY
jgi:hypothetical protein